MNWSSNRWFTKIAKTSKKLLCHDFENKCIKWFSKFELIMTNLCHHLNLSRYRQFSCKFIEKTYWNNKWMILYNSWLLHKYEIHINVEICINAKLVKYLYKYIFKKNDHVDVFFNIVNVSIRRINEFHANRQNNEKFVDEIKIFHDVYWIKFCEIVWRIFDFSFDEIKLIVIQFQLHLKNQNRILINFNDKKIRDAIDRKRKISSNFNWSNISNLIAKLMKSNAITNFLRLSFARKIAKSLWIHENIFIKTFSNFSFETNKKKRESRVKKTNA